MPDVIARLALGLAAFLLATPMEPGPESPAPVVTRLEANAVALAPDDPARLGLGGLRFLAGWALSSSDPRFGGISAIRVEKDRVLAISDAGAVLRFPVPDGDEGRLHIASLADGPGTGRRKSDRDSESLVVGGDQAWIGFEGRQEIWRYRLPGFAAEASAAPAPMQDWGSNSGAEAMVRLPDGRFLVFAEGGERQATTAAVLFEGDPAEPGTAARRFRYRPPSRHRITDAALLPDRRLLLLHRRFTMADGLSIRIAVADPAEIREGAILEGREVAAWAPPLTVDNMEALSVDRENGRTIVWIASDDNFNPLQRSLLMKFEWAE